MTTTHVMYLKYKCIRVCLVFDSVHHNCLLLPTSFLRELAVHIDGFIAAVAHSHVVGSSKVGIN